MILDLARKNVFDCAIGLGVLNLFSSLRYINFELSIIFTNHILKHKSDFQIHISLASSTRDLDFARSLGDAAAAAELNEGISIITHSLLLYCLQAFA